MPKHNQSATIGSITNFISNPSPLPEPDRITALETRVSTLESLLNDVMQQLDKPYRDQEPHKSAKHDLRNQSKRKTPKTKDTTPIPKTRKTPPSAIILKTLKNNPQSRIEIETNSTLSLDAINKCFGYLLKKNLIEKTNDKDDDGNSKWRLIQP